MYDYDKAVYETLKKSLPSIEELLRRPTTMTEILKARLDPTFKDARLDLGNPTEYTYNPTTNTFRRIDGHDITPALYNDLIRETTAEHAEDPMDVVSNYEQQGILNTFARVMQNIYTRRVEIEENDELKLNPFSYREQLKQVDEDLDYVLTLMTGHNRPQGTLTISALNYFLSSRGLL